MRARGDRTSKLFADIKGSLEMTLMRILAGSQTQKGIITYAISANRQRPLAGAAHAAVFNTWRRTRAQWFYWMPPFAIAYLAIDWAVKKWVVLYSLVSWLASG